MVLNTINACISSENLPDQEARQILLPHHSESVAQIALDIGGSLAKVVWFSKSPGTSGGRLHFTKFETQNISACIDFIRNVLYPSYHADIPPESRYIIATGGGAHKYHDLLREKLGVEIQKRDEMDCLITADIPGLNFLVRKVSYEVFTYDERREAEPLIYEEMPSEFFPYMLVNIGSGVSIIKVTDEMTQERISGTSLGGGTLWGLLSLLTKAKDYDEMLELSAQGENKNVDMLVGDIYGGDYPKIGLKATTIASSFGKVFKMPPEEKEKLRQEDIARSLLYLVSNNIGQIAYLNAQAHGITKIYFSGFFIRGHPATMNTLSYAINFWSKGKIKALFLRHEGYLGAMGAFLRQTPSQAQRLGSFQESFITAQKIAPLSISAIGVLNETPSALSVFPLLSRPEAYHADTLHLTEASSQHYWIDKLDTNLEKLAEMAIQWDSSNTTDTLQRANAFKEMYRTHLQQLRKEPNSYGLFSVRSLLNLREQCLREMGFTDIFKNIKSSENEAALVMLPGLLKDLDKLQGPELVNQLLDNVLAGNMYDWGSASTLELLRRAFFTFFIYFLEKHKNKPRGTGQKLTRKGQLDFDQARAKVGKSHLDQREPLVHRLLSGPAFKKCIILVDNSGADIILGILPFAQFLLQRGTTVVLAANTAPSVNDVTAIELQEILIKVALISPFLSDCLHSSRLRVVASGSASPCINLNCVSQELANEAKDADLVVLEGMGRAIHTNFYATFTVASLKLAVFKNDYVANNPKFKVNLYDGMCLYTE